MKKRYLLLFSCLLLIVHAGCVNGQSKTLKLVFIRHGEKNKTGENLNCQGINRSLQLPALLYKKFGRPSNIFVPEVGGGLVSKHSRMFQTITPFAVKYQLSINSVYDEDDAKDVARALLKESGTVIIVWEHNNIPEIVARLGIRNVPDWPGNDFDSIWIVTFNNGVATLTRDKEGLNPSSGCPF